MAFDFKGAIKKSKIQKGVEGKTFLWYADPKVGKTLNFSKMPSPLLLAFEHGYESVHVDYMDIPSWKKFLEWLKWSEQPENLEWLKENYKTIGVDTADIAISYAEKYTCSRFGISDMGEAVLDASGKVDGGKNSYKAMRKEFADAMTRLVKLGLTVVWICHAGTREFTDNRGVKSQRIYPKGDRGCIDFLVETASLTAYIRANGFDEQGHEIPSSAYLCNTPQWQAGGRLTNVTAFLPEFSAQAFIKAIEDGVEATEAAYGIKAVSAEEIKADEIKEEVKTADELKKQINQVVMCFYDKASGKIDPKAVKVVENYLGVNGKVSAATDDQVDQLELILSDLQDLAKAEGK